jgi:DNA repair photolyase
MPGDTITSFYGEFLVNPVPLEWSGAYCSHACPYCFANLNSEYRKQTKGVPLRYADVKNTINLIQQQYERDSMEAFWLREGYPVLLSNKVDPFSNSNYRTALPLINLMAEMDIPMAFQTKGGRGIDEALEVIKPSVWYITIEFSDESLARQLEPAAPSIESRYELIAKLRDRGHEVVLGLNPLSVEWCPEPEKILQRCKDLGVWGVWTELLHFNKDQAALAGQHGVIPQAMIDRYRVKKRPEEALFKHWLRTRNIAHDLGLEVFSGGQTCHSRYFDAYKRCYPKLLPTMQDWVNHCIDEGWDSNKLISFAEFADFFLPLLPHPDKKLRVGHYFGATCHQIPREMGEKWSNWMTWQELLELSWRDRRVKWCPVKMPAFAYVGGEGWDKKKRFENLLSDETGMPYMAFWQQYQEFLLEDV